MLTTALFPVTHGYLTCKPVADNFSQQSPTGLQLAVLHGFVYPEINAIRVSNALKLVEVNSYQQGFELARLKRVDGFVEMSIRLRYHLDQMDSPASCLTLEDFSQVIPPLEIRLTSNAPADHPLRLLLEQRITDMKKTGEIDRIVESYAPNH